MERLAAVSAQMPVVFPVHPRTRKMMAGLDLEAPGLELVDPVGYLDFLSLLADAAGVLTDSGGIQEEAPSFGVPVLVLRDSTERMAAVEAGSAWVVGTDPTRILAEAGWVLGSRLRLPLGRNPFGDGQAAERIIEAVDRWFQGAHPLLLPAREFQPASAARLEMV